MLLFGSGGPEHQQVINFFGFYTVFFYSVWFLYRLSKRFCYVSDYMALLALLYLGMAVAHAAQTLWDL